MLWAFNLNNKTSETEPKSERNADQPISFQPHEYDTDPTFFEDELVSLKDLKMR